MFRLTGKILLIATLVSAGSLHGGHKVDQDARSEMVEAAESEGRDLILDEEKAVARSVLKKPTLPKKPVLTDLQVKQKAKEEADAAAKKEKSGEVRRTLKGIKYEAEEEEEVTTHAPQSLRLKAENVENERQAEHRVEEQEREEEKEEEHDEDKADEEHDEEPKSDTADNWLFPGAQVEWNPMVGKKAKHLLAERDWLVVTVVDKEHDEHGKVRYGIKKGGLRTNVAPEQLRKAVKHLKEAEEKKKADNFWKAQHNHHNPTLPPSDGFEDVMIPMHASVGSTCKAEPVRLGDKTKEIKEGIDAEDCRMLCENDKTCQYSSHGVFKFHDDDKPKVHCAKFTSCDETTGKGYRTWVKARLEPDGAQKARNAERLEDEYMEKILQAEEVANQALLTKEEQEEEAEAKKATEPSGPSASGQAITIQGQSVKLTNEEEAQNQQDAPIWRIVLEVGAVMMISLMFLKRGLKNRKSDTSPGSDTESEKETNAFIKMRVWLQRESKEVMNLLSGSKKQDAVDMEFGTMPQEEPKKKANDARSFGAVPEEDPEEEEEAFVGADEPVNKSALRAAFAASNKRAAA